MWQRFLTRFKASWSVHALLDQRWISELLAWSLLAASTLPISRQRRLALRTKGARRTETGLSRAFARRLLKPALLDQQKRTDWRRHHIGWDRYHGNLSNIGRDRALTTSLILKEPGPDGEKGVLYSSFEFNWMRILANHDARAFLNDYLLVGASSWSPGDHAVLASLQGLSADPAFIGISNESDIEHYRLWEPGVTPLPITAGDWIDPNFYKPLPHAEREVDIVMVSHFADWKRHWLLFDALRHMRTDLRIVLIGRDGNQRTEKDIWREAEAFGVKQHIEIYKNLEIDEVSKYQCNARVAVALSRREGSCVAVTEAMFANTPVVMMEDAHIGTRRFINETTGRLSSRRRLPFVLSEMIDNSARYAPRKWAIEHISAQITSAKLNTILREHCLQRGLPWTRDITPMCWRYVPDYLNPEDAVRMEPAIERLKREHGIILSRFAGERKSAELNIAASAAQQVPA
jgi:glycosyltransferase involved in cell wall biosynthesis